MLKKIAERLAEKFDLDVNQIDEDTTFKDDLALDSLDLMELVMDIEAEYDITFPEEELEKLETVADVVEFLEGQGITE